MPSSKIDISNGVYDARSPFSRGQDLCGFDESNPYKTPQLLKLFFFFRILVERDLLITKRDIKSSLL